MEVARIRCGMNYETASLKLFRLREVLEAANEDLKDLGITLTCSLDTQEENDGGPYPCNTATFYYLCVNSDVEVPDGLVQGVKDLLDAL